MKDKKTSRKRLWLYRIAAVIAAVVIWLMVVNTDDPVTRKRISNIPITFENTQVFTNNGMTYAVEGDIDTATVIVYARRTVVDDITAADFSASVDFNMINDMNGAVPVQVSYNGRTSIDSFSVVTDTIRITSENVISETFDVNITTQGALPEDYSVGTITPDPAQVIVTGPDSVVSSIYSVGAIVDISGASEDITQTVELHYYNFRGQEMDLSEYGDELYISDDTGVITSADVHISILYGTVVPVEYQIGGTMRVADGCVYTGYQAGVTTASIRGPEDVVTSMGSIVVSSNDLNVANADSDVSVTIDLADHVPAGVLVEGDSLVDVVMYVERLVTNVYEIDPEDITLNGADTDRYSYTYDGEAVTVALTGIGETVDAVAAEDLVLSCDVSGLEEGTYQVPVTVAVPEGCTLEDDVYAGIIVTENETETESGPVGSGSEDMERSSAGEQSPEDE